MENITLTFEPGPADAYNSCREYIGALVHMQGRQQKAIAADMDLCPSALSRKVAQSPNDSMRFTLDDLERFLEVTGDLRPIYYLVEKYNGSRQQRIDALRAELERLEGCR